MIRRKALLASLLLGVAACGDATLKKLSVNITRDSALKLLSADAAPGDSVPHVYRENQYLVDGKFYKIAFYTPTDRKEMSDTASGTPIAEGELTPLVFVNDTLTGWGWDHWKEVAATINLPVTPPR
jgi:hypothetical protein